MTSKPEPSLLPLLPLSGDPFLLFETWFAEAEQTEINDPNCMSLATVDAGGMPNVRIVLLKGIDAAAHQARGFVFFTNYQSAKGRELLLSGKAAICFHWKSLRRQVRARGLISTVGESEADAYFASRSRDSRIGAWASQQSRPLGRDDDLQNAFAAYTGRFEGQDVPRPPHWSGFRLTPIEIEYWQDRPHRLHDRVQFSRAGIADPWTASRLYP